MKNEAKNQPPKSLLKAAIEKTDDVKGQFNVGLGAIKGNEKQKFVVPDTRKITGSLDIDTSTKEKYPLENRWDYTNKFAILPNSKYARQLAQLNLMPVKQWNYNTLGLSCEEIKGL